ncbi:SapC family protein [Sphingomonas sp. MMS24-JH45]
MPHPLPPQRRARPPRRLCAVRIRGRGKPVPAEEWLRTPATSPWRWTSPRSRSAGQAGAQVHLDTAHPAHCRRRRRRPPLRRPGRPSPWLEAAMERLAAFDAGFAAMSDMVAAWRRLDLLEPMTVEVTLRDGSTNRLVGYHGVNEGNVEALDAAALGDLHAAGHLLPLFMAIASLGNVGKLVARRDG